LGLGVLTALSSFMARFLERSRQTGISNGVKMSPPSRTNA
jgi:hypothetical protein